MACNPKRGSVDARAHFKTLSQKLQSVNLLHHEKSQMNFKRQKKQGIDMSKPDG
jgi:hypothetical protein